MDSCVVPQTKQRPTDFFRARINDPGHLFNPREEKTNQEGVRFTSRRRLSEPDPVLQGRPKSPTRCGSRGTKGTIRQFAGLDGTWCRSSGECFKTTATINQEGGQVHFQAQIK
jgi:hypothetical protein